MSESQTGGHATTADEGQSTAYILHADGAEDVCGAGTSDVYCPGLEDVVQANYRYNQRLRLQSKNRHPCPDERDRRSGNLQVVQQEWQAEYHDLAHSSTAFTPSKQWVPRELLIIYQFEHSIVQHPDRYKNAWERVSDDETAAAKPLEDVAWALVAIEDEGKPHWTCSHCTSDPEEAPHPTLHLLKTKHIQNEFSPISWFRVLLEFMCLTTAMISKWK